MALSADPDHRRVAGVLEKFRGRLVTSNVIFDETVTLVLYRLGHPSAVKVGSTLVDSTVVDLIRVTTADEQAAWHLFTERGDKTYSYTDCTSFVLMRRLQIGMAAALDEDQTSSKATRGNAPATGTGLWTDGRPALLERRVLVAADAVLAVDEHPIRATARAESGALRRCCPV